MDIVRKACECCAEKDEVNPIFIFYCNLGLSLSFLSFGRLTPFFHRPKALGLVPAPTQLPRWPKAGHSFCKQLIARVLMHSISLLCSTSTWHTGRYQNETCQKLWKDASILHTNVFPCILVLGFSVHLATLSTWACQEILKFSLLSRHAIIKYLA